MTQRALAERLEVPRSFVARLELGDRRVDLVEFIWICQACGVSPDKTAAQLLRDMQKLERGARRSGVTR
ncbi:MAG: helix-turn-helix transcriptional regulator [Planctomycetia bacterium]|nr:helix-turn-helix transcriptional regulator [Planctomycetia bacterium]